MNEKESIGPEKVSFRGPWLVEIGPKGEVVGLPEGLKREDILLRISSEGKWEAFNPPPEIIEEIEKWRSDWMTAE